MNFIFTMLQVLLSVCVPLFFLGFAIATFVQLYDVAIRIWRGELKGWKILSTLSIGLPIWFFGLFISFVVGSSMLGLVVELWNAPMVTAAPLANLRELVPTVDLDLVELEKGGVFAFRSWAMRESLYEDESDAIFVLLPFVSTAEKRYSNSFFNPKEIPEKMTVIHYGSTRLHLVAETIDLHMSLQGLAKHLLFNELRHISDLSRYNREDIAPEILNKFDGLLWRAREIHQLANKADIQLPDTFKYLVFDESDNEPNQMDLSKVQLGNQMKSLRGLVQRLIETGTDDFTIEEIEKHSKLAKILNTKQGYPVIRPFILKKRMKQYEVVLAGIQQEHPEASVYVQLPYSWLSYK